MSAQIKKTGTFNCSPIEEADVAAIMKNNITVAPNIIPNSYSLNTTISGNTTLADYKRNGFGVRTYSQTISSNYKEIIQWMNILKPVLGGVYTFSFWARGSGVVRIYFYGNTGYVPCVNVVNSDGNTGNGGDGWNDITLTPNWKKHWSTFTLRATGDATIAKHLLVRHVYSATNPTVTMDFTQPKFELSSIATPWCPNIDEFNIPSLETITDPVEGHIIYEI